MFKRTALFAFRRGAVVGLATLVSSAADARPHGNGGQQPWRSRRRRRRSRHRSSSWHRPSSWPRSPPHIPGLNRHRHLHHRHHLTIRPGCWLHQWRCRPPIGVTTAGITPGTATAVGRSSSVATTRSLLCADRSPGCIDLHLPAQDYLPNGSVLFRDVCTNESAVNPPAQAAEVLRREANKKQQEQEVLEPRHRPGFFVFVRLAVGIRKFLRHCGWIRRIVMANTAARRRCSDQYLGWFTSSQMSQTQRSSTMFKRTALFALVAAAVVGLASLVSTAADARGQGGGHGQVVAATVVRAT